jgi:hypothetical protein
VQFAQRLGNRLDSLVQGLGDHPLVAARITQHQRHRIATPSRRAVADLQLGYLLLEAVHAVCYRLDVGKGRGEDLIDLGLIQLLLDFTPPGQRRQGGLVLLHPAGADTAVESKGSGAVGGVEVDPYLECKWIPVQVHVDRKHQKRRIRKDDVAIAYRADDLGGCVCQGISLGQLADNLGQVHREAGTARGDLHRIIETAHPEQGRVGVGGLHLQPVQVAPEEQILHVDRLVVGSLPELVACFLETGNEFVHHVGVRVSGAYAQPLILGTYVVAYVAEPVTHPR